MLSSEHKNVEQVLLETVKVATFLVENRCVVDICQFVGLDCIGNYAIADLGLLAVHAEVQALQHVLKDIGNLFEFILVITKYAVVVTITDYFV